MLRSGADAFITFMVRNELMIPMLRRLKELVGVKPRKVMVPTAILELEVDLLRHRALTSAENSLDYDKEIDKKGIPQIIATSKSGDQIFVTKEGQ